VALNSGFSPASPSLGQQGVPSWPTEAGLHPTRQRFVDWYARVTQQPETGAREKDAMHDVEAADPAQRFAHRLTPADPGLLDSTRSKSGSGAAANPDRAGSRRPKARQMDLETV
jgi:hypothetical protein